MQNTLATKDERTGHAVRFALVMTFPFFLLVALCNLPYRDLPFWGDSLGYMIANVHYMVETPSIMSPADHDPGHPPITFWAIALAWKLLGHDLLVSHGVQWVWGAFLLSGMFALGLALSDGSRLFASIAAGLTILHPVTFAMTMQLVPDLALGAMLVWTLAMLYLERRAGYVVALALLALTKANAWPQIAIIGACEFILIPCIQLIYFRSNRRARAAVLRWCGSRIGLSLLAAYPLLLWILAHRYYQGFWMQSERFAGTSSITFDWGYFVHEMKNGVRWSIWGSEGNQGIVYAGMLAAALLGLIYWRARHAAWMRNALRASRELRTLRPPLVAALSLAMQCLLTVFLYALKEEKIVRYFYPVMLYAIAILVALLAQLFALSNKKSAPTQFRLMRGFVLILAVLVCGNLWVRWHPAFTARLPVPPAAREWLRNKATIGYEYNLQIVPVLRMNREAIRYVEDLYHQPGAKPRIVANYPFSAALKYPEAGHLLRDESIPVLTDFHAIDFMRRDWDYFINSPLAWNALEHESMPEFPAIAEVDRNFSEPENTWGYKVLVFRIRESWRPGKADRRGKAIAQK